MIRIKSGLELKRPKFSCDSVISPNIAPCFPNTSFNALVVGASGSGKTSLVLSMLQDKKAYYRCFRKIIVVMPQASRNSIVGNPFEYMPSEQLFEVFDATKILELIEKYNDEIKEEDAQKGRKIKNRHILLVMDDIASSLKDKHNLKIYKMLASNRRHFNVSMFTMVQFMSSVPLPVRQQTTFLINFLPRHTKDWLYCKNEFLQKDDKTCQMIFDECFKNPHDFLMIDTGTKRIHANFDLLVL